MDLQYWLYIIIGVIYLLNQLRKKPEEQQTDFPSPKPERSNKRFELPDAKPTAQRPMTFEELLKEITTSKSAPASTPETSQKEREYVNYDDDIPSEVQEPEEVASYENTRRNRTNQVYDEAKRQAFLKSSFEDTLKLSDTDATLGKFKASEQKRQRNLAHDYSAALRDPKELKKAFVMSEILKPKF